MLQSRFFELQNLEKKQSFQERPNGDYDQLDYYSCQKCGGTSQGQLSTTYVKHYKWCPISIMKIEEEFAL